MERRTLFIIFPTPPAFCLSVLCCPINVCLSLLISHLSVTVCLSLSGSSSLSVSVTFARNTPSRNNARLSASLLSRTSLSFSLLLFLILLSTSVSYPSLYFYFSILMSRLRISFGLAVLMSFEATSCHVPKFNNLGFDLLQRVAELLNLLEALENAKQITRDQEMSHRQRTSSE